MNFFREARRKWEQGFGGTDPAGRIVFYPGARWAGLWPSGYATDEAGFAALVALARRYHLTVLAILLAVWPLFLVLAAYDVQRAWIPFAICIPLAALAEVAYGIAMRRRLRGLSKAGEKGLGMYLREHGKLLPESSAGTAVLVALSTVIVIGGIVLTGVFLHRISQGRGGPEFGVLAMFFLLFSAALSWAVVHALRSRALAARNRELERQVAERTRALEAANRHKSEFLASMSHELRTPLNAIIGFADVMKAGMAGPLTDQQKEFIGDIGDSGKHLLSLINDVLDLSKIEAGRMELALAPFDLPQAIEGAAMLVRGRAEKQGIALTVEIAEGLGEFNGDERKVKQILVNLLSNAVKFTPEGGAVTLRAARTGQDIEISVSDTGIGIAPEDQSAAFEEFRQVGGDAARKAEGTGLGLALTKKLVELHGGTIRVASTMGRGSTFTFNIPASRP